MKTRKLIQEMKENFVKVTPKQEKAILKYWGENIGNEFTEQDICRNTVNFKILKKVKNLPTNT